MPGGLIQLISRGAQDIYLTGNPILTFFKSVYKKHTNFAMESINQEYDTIPNFTTTDTTIVFCKIGRDGDLINDMYLIYDLPNIYSTSYENFRWVKNVGQVIVKSAELLVGGIVIDRLYSQWLNIWNEVSLSTIKHPSYNKMVGENIKSSGNFGIYGINANPTYYRQRLYVPLDFWFTRNSGLAIPLIALQYIEVTVKIEYEQLNKLFTLGGLNQSPEEFFDQGGTIPGYSLSNIFWKFVNNSISNQHVWNQRTYLDVNYVFLDEEERKVFAQSTHEYLIIQTQQRVIDGLNNPTNILELYFEHPTLEFIWVLQRNDVNKYNDWFNYTSSLNAIPVYDFNNFSLTNAVDFDNGFNIMYTARIVYNGNDRVSDKDHTYFNAVQPFRYHSGSPKEGIYVYSFSLNPEDFQPSGSSNLSAINRTEFVLHHKDTTNVDHNYTLYMYTRSYNVFRITSGLGSLVFAS
jgi:hypothetical protein